MDGAQYPPIVITLRVLVETMSGMGQGTMKRPAIL